MRPHVKHIHLLLSNLLDKVLPVAYQMVGRVYIAGNALGIAVPLVKPRVHVNARVIMTALQLRPRKNPSARDTSPILKVPRLRISESDIFGEDLVELLHQCRLAHSCLRLLLLLLLRLVFPRSLLYRCPLERLVSFHHIAIRFAAYWC